jgi:hypothetical protein
MRQYLGMIDKEKNSFLGGIETASNYTPKQAAVSFAPIGLAAAGGAVGNQIHGDTGTLNGVTYDPQAHNDDEYDGTGALLGLAAGMGLNLKKGIGVQKGDAVIRRLKERTGKVSDDERMASKIYGSAMHSAGLVDATNKLLRR